MVLSLLCPGYLTQGLLPLCRRVKGRLPVIYVRRLCLGLSLQWCREERGVGSALSVRGLHTHTYNLRSSAKMAASRSPVRPVRENVVVQSRPQADSLPIAPADSADTGSPCSWGYWSDSSSAWGYWTDDSSSSSPGEEEFDAVPEARVFSLAPRPGLSRLAENATSACSANDFDIAGRSPLPGVVLGPGMTRAPRLSLVVPGLAPGPHADLDVVASSGPQGAPLPGEVGDVDSDAEEATMRPAIPPPFSTAVSAGSPGDVEAGVVPSIPSSPVLRDKEVNESSRSPSTAVSAGLADQDSKAGTSLSGSPLISSRHMRPEFARRALGTDLDLVADGSADLGTDLSRSLSPPFVGSSRVPACAVSSPPMLLVGGSYSSVPPSSGFLPVGARHPDPRSTRPCGAPSSVPSVVCLPSPPLPSVGTAVISSPARGLLSHPHQRVRELSSSPPQEVRGLSSPSPQEVSGLFSLPQEVGGPPSPPPSIDQDVRGLLPRLLAHFP